MAYCPVLPVQSQAKPQTVPQLRRLDLRIRVDGRHPWFFRKMVRKPETAIPAGSAVVVYDRDGSFVGTGFYNPRTDLALRMLDRANVDDSDARLGQLLDAAIELRESTLALPRITDGYRLVHAEGDGFPGLILDRLGDTLVAELYSLCMQQRIEAIGERLLARYPGSHLRLLVDPTARKREGMATVPPSRPHQTEVVEHGLRYLVEPGGGHKTGFFADQRDNRWHLRHLARDRRVLDLCCNAGGFALNAKRGGAKRVLAVDLDEVAAAQARANAKRNQLDVEVAHDDAFDLLRGVDTGSFDLIVLDPPKWASGKREVEAGLQRYGDLNRSALSKVARGGFIVTCSCSGALSEDRFLTMLRRAASAARRDVRVLRVAGAGPDHPVALECPETRYLKVVTLQVR